MNSKSFSPDFADISSEEWEFGISHGQAEDYIQEIEAGQKLFPPQEEPDDQNSKDNDP